MAVPSLVVSTLSFAWPDGSPVFDGLDLAFGAGRFGLVGGNGSGKSTFLRLAAGALAPSRGGVRVDGRLAYLPQHPSRRVGATVADWLGVAEKRRALAALADGSVDPSLFEIIDDDWDVDERTLAALSALSLPTRLRPAPGLLDRTADDLSGGELTLLALVGLFLAKPDVALLDEPTNNLDADARRWLRGVVARWEGLLIIAGHDRELLDGMDGIVEFSRGTARRYGGGYAAFAAQKDADRAVADRRVRENESALARGTRALADAQTRAARAARAGKSASDKSRFVKAAINQRASDARAHAGAARAEGQARVAEAAAALRAARDVARRDDLLRIDLPDTDAPAGQILCEITQGGRDWTVAGPERIALSGPNGSGKTTVMEAILGLRRTAGLAIRRRIDGIGYVPQRIEFADEGVSLIETLRATVSTMPEGAVRERLAAFLFRGAVVERAVGGLSGGERLRLALAMALSQTPAPRLLLLDEPTNHLDLAGIDQLAGALRTYRGAFIVVSHDVAFLREIGITREWIVRDRALAEDRPAPFPAR